MMYHVIVDLPSGAQVTHRDSGGVDETRAGTLRVHVGLGVVAYAAGHWDRYAVDAVPAS